MMLAFHFSDKARERSFMWQWQQTVHAMLNKIKDLIVEIHLS
jgi:hypothetical protein